MGESSTSAKPIVFVLDDENDGLPMDYQSPSPVIYTDSGNVTLWVRVLMPYDVYNADSQGTVMWLGGYLTSVSYSASWLNILTASVYTNASASNQAALNFTLTNVPYGEHQLRVNASCVVFILDQYSPLSSHAFYDSTEKSLNFTVAPVPTPAPTTSLSPSSTSSPALSPTPTTTPEETTTLVPTQIPTLEPSATPNIPQENLTSVAIIAGTAIAVIVVIGLLAYFAKHRGKK